MAYGYSEGETHGLFAVLAACELPDTAFCTNLKMYSHYNHNGISSHAAAYNAKLILLCHYMDCTIGYLQGGLERLRIVQKLSC